MKRLLFILSLGIGCLVQLSPEAQAQRGFRGGGNRSPSRSAPSRNMSRPSTPSRNMSRPSTPNMSRPSQPSFNRPAQMPSRPSQSPAYRPSSPSNINRPSNLPSSGFKPNYNRPSTLPGNTRPGMPSTLPGNTRPGLPSTLQGNTRPNLPSTLPGNTRPSVPGLGPNRPTQLPANRPGNNRPGNNLPGNNFPNIGDNRPGNNRPGLPNNGGNHFPNLPNNQPNFPNIGDNRPGNNFPNIGDNRPGNNFPNIGDNRPGNNFPNRRPEYNRPIVNTGDINIGNRNNVINNRPSWVNMDRNRFNNINNNWRGQINNIANWDQRHPDRLDHWENWGDNVRHHWDDYHDHDHWFDHDWWDHHHHDHCGWHYGYYNRPLSYWWTVPTYAYLSSWFTWPTPPPATIWQEPVYYDYGTGGNVTYEDNSVYINNQLVATEQEYVEALWTQATVPAPATEEEAKAAEWQPLGTFAVSTDEKDVQPSLVLQLAVNKAGVVSGTLYNTQTDKTQTIQGSVDPQTQRAVFRIGDSESLIVETGLYNLTKDFTPIMVHYGTDKRATYMMVRLEAPETQEQPVR